MRDLTRTERTARAITREASLRDEAVDYWRTEEGQDTPASAVLDLDCAAVIGETRGREARLDAVTDHNAVWCALIRWEHWHGGARPDVLAALHARRDRNGEER
jgi:hypothetical protein